MQITLKNCMLTERKKAPNKNCKKDTEKTGKENKKAEVETTTSSKKQKHERNTDM